MMNILLQPEVQKYIEQKIESGEFHSPDEAVNSLLAQMRGQEVLTPEDIEDLRAEVDIGIAEADRGEFVEFTAESIIAERKAARKKVS